MNLILRNFKNSEIFNLNNKLDFKNLKKYIVLSNLSMYWKYETLKKFQGQSI